MAGSNWEAHAPSPWACGLVESLDGDRMIFWKDGPISNLLDSTGSEQSLHLHTVYVPKNLMPPQILQWHNKH